MMKIPLFSKSSVIRASFSLVVAILIVGLPGEAHASFFSDLVTKVFGGNAQAAEITPSSNSGTHNSQTVPLLESSVNPDLKNMKDDDSATTAIVGDQAITADTQLSGTDTIDKQYASSAEITTYTVKPGDSIAKVAQKFGISKNTIIQSNDFLNSKGTLTVGQVLTILPVDGVVYTVRNGDTVSSIAKKYNVAMDDILSYNDIAKASDLQLGDTITIPGAVAPNVSDKPATPTQKTDTTPVVKQPQKQLVFDLPTTPQVSIDTQATTEGTDTQTDTNTNSSATPSSATPASSGFIWPVPLGVGRVSQWLHDDNA
ncbi:MAG TPA: LysM peptidoglycan-binding domain-containing protein, partial [Cyclobacteriaceae bacterium]|nr:LysM peptidoglycan-binding domain-containing protein [Cyclobacteriaceae bacterium]